MADDFESEDKKTVKNKISKLLDEMCLHHESENIEADMVALFEDIIQFFSGREEEFFNFDELSEDARLAIYTEIKNIIELLKLLKGAKDKEAVMQMLSENLITNLSKHSTKFKSAAEQLSKREQKDLKRRFADAILLELYRQHQLYIVQKRNPPKELMDGIEKYVEEVRLNTTLKQLRTKHSDIKKQRSHAKNVGHSKREYTTGKTRQI